MKVALQVASSLAILVASNAQDSAIATTINRVHTTYLGESGYGLGGFSYQPYTYQAVAGGASFQPSTYQGAAFYQHDQPFTSTAVLNAPVQTPLATTSYSHVQPVFHAVHQPAVHIAATPQVLHHQEVQHVETPTAVLGHSVPQVLATAQVVPTQVTTQTVQPVAVRHSAAIVQPVVEHHSDDTQVLRFQPDHYNEIRVLHRHEPPQIEQVTIKDPKITVVDVSRPGQPPMKLFQVMRTPNPPTTIEFVNDVPNETQVTVLDDDDQPSQREFDPVPLEPRGSVPAKQVSRSETTASRYSQIPYTPTPLARNQFGDEQKSFRGRRRFVSSQRRDFENPRRSSNSARYQ